MLQVDTRRLEEEVRERERERERGEKRRERGRKSKSYLLGGDTECVMAAYVISPMGMIISNFAMPCSLTRGS